mgnify:CR=1 FL=1
MQEWQKARLVSNAQQRQLLGLSIAEYNALTPFELYCEIEAFNEIQRLAGGKIILSIPNHKEDKARAKANKRFAEYECEMRKRINEYKAANPKVFNNGD